MDTDAVPSQQEDQIVPIPDVLLEKLSEPIKNEFIRWDEGRCKEIDELRNRSVQMEKTMKWWSDCTANWREKWGKVRAERNKARDQCKALQMKLDSVYKECNSLKYSKMELMKEYKKVIKELAQLKCVPVSSLESLKFDNNDVDLDSSYAPSSAEEPSLKSELNFIEDVLRKSEEQYLISSRPTSVCSEHLPSRVLSRPDRKFCQASFDPEERLAGVDLTKLKLLLEDTQRHLHEEKNSKIALAQSVESCSRENTQLRKKIEEYKRQRAAAIEKVSRIELESGDKLARLSLEIEGESESRTEMDKKIREMRADIERLQAENATEWARRERIETEKSALERENKNLKLQLQELEDTASRKATMPSQTSEFKTLQADLYDKSKELEMLRGTYTRTKKQLNEKNGELEHCQKRLDVIEEEVYNLRKRVEDLKKELLNREDEVDMRNNQIRKLQRNCDELTEHNDSLTTQMSSLESRLRQRTDAMFNPNQRNSRVTDLSDDDTE